MPDKSKVLVTGANGLLGSNVVWCLSHSNEYTARAMIRKNANTKALENTDCEIFEGEITNPNDIEKAMVGCRFVIHCAAITSQHPNNLEHYRKGNLESTANLLEISQKNNIERFVFVSTANCFTNGSLQNPGDETGGFMPWLRASGYAYSKHLAQQMVLECVNKCNLSAIIVAPSFLIGPRDAKPSSGTLLLYALKNKILFCPPGGKSFVDAQLASQALVNALTMGNSGQTYLLTGENLTFYNFFKMVEKVSGKNKWIIPLPYFLLKAIALGAEAIHTIFKISLPVSEVNVKLLCLDNYFTNEKARKHLAMEHTNLHSTIEKTIQWFRQNGYC